MRDVAYLAHGTELLARAKAGAGQHADALEVVDEALELLESTDMTPAIESLQRLREELERARDLVRAQAPASAPDGSASLSPIEQLTARETEVLALVATGLSNREIAKRLCVSVGTVKTHMHRILAKLDAPNRTRAVHRARLAGVIA